MQRRIAIATVWLALAASIVAPESTGSESVMWGCALPGQRGNVLYLMDAGSRSYVKFASQRIPAEHVGIDATHRWQWGGAKGNSVELLPDGLAAYYEAGDTSAPKQRFRCKQMG